MAAGKRIVRRKIPPAAALRAIRMVVLDVDGVLSDGRIIYDDDGVEYKVFDAHDGHGIRIAIASGITFAVISGRKSEVVPLRAAQLGIADIIQGEPDKLPQFRKLLRKHGIDPARTCVIGDDLPDIPILRACGFSVAPSTAVSEVRRVVDYVTLKPGGRGAIREAIDLIMAARST